MDCGWICIPPEIALGIRNLRICIGVLSIGWIIQPIQHSKNSINFKSQIWKEINGIRKCYSYNIAWIFQPTHIHKTYCRSPRTTILQIAIIFIKNINILNYLTDSNDRWFPQISISIDISLYYIPYLLFI